LLIATRAGYATTHSDYYSLHCASSGDGSTLALDDGHERWVVKDKLGRWHGAKVVLTVHVNDKEKKHEGNIHRLEDGRWRAKLKKCFSRDCLGCTNCAWDLDDCSLSWYTCVYVHVHDIS